MKQRDFIKIKKTVRNGFIVAILVVVTMGAGRIGDLRHKLEDTQILVKKQKSKIQAQNDELQSLRYDVEVLKAQIEQKAKVPVAKAEVIQEEKKEIKPPSLAPVLVVGGVIVVAGVIVNIVKTLAVGL